MTANSSHPLDPVKPGHIKIVRLAKEGRLARGDLVETATLGTCEVTGISSVDSLTVKAYDGSRHELTGIGWASRARLVETSRNDAGESEEADDASVAPAPRG
ncbi:MAG: hypothetical protein K0Q43_128 [Ramlibacter sp.]|jgi:hypothetical protein|nr:hypothetical protein [Ramlibacter sp.]